MKIIVVRFFSGILFSKIIRTYWSYLSKSEYIFCAVLEVCLKKSRQVSHQVLLSVLFEEIWSGVTSGVTMGVTPSIFGNRILKNRESAFWLDLGWLLPEIKMKHCPFIKFDHYEAIFGFQKRETFLFSQRKFFIHFSALYITYGWGEKMWEAEL